MQKSDTQVRYLSGGFGDRGMDFYVQIFVECVAYED
jgi:hypothetical protein